MTIELVAPVQGKIFCLVCFEKFPSTLQTRTYNTRSSKEKENYSSFRLISILKQTQETMWFFCNVQYMLDRESRTLSHLAWFLSQFKGAKVENLSLRRPSLSDYNDFTKRSLIPKGLPQNNVSILSVLKNPCHIWHTMIGGKESRFHRD